jgi:hypothetical protein
MAGWKILLLRSRKRLSEHARELEAPTKKARILAKSARRLVRDTEAILAKCNSTIDRSGKNLRKSN